MSTSTPHSQRSVASPGIPATPGVDVPVVLSFDVEEHFLIEAAVGLSVAEELQGHYRQRVDTATRWLLEDLGEAGVRATFFVVGHIARYNPGLVRDIALGGHEVASHGLDHSRLQRHTAATFRAAVRTSKDLLEDTSGTAVTGFRAPTFSLVPETSWAVDVLAEAGFRYDSSIYPVRHDRYGVPAAPRTPFVVRGREQGILELPPLTYRFLGMNVPVGGGGYFRLLPTWLLHRGIAQMRAHGGPAVVMLYFHPWEFDTQQARLPLRRLARWRTYAGIGRTRERLRQLLRGPAFVRANEAAASLQHPDRPLELFDLAPVG
jgi:polysaccharide deacetylase family protein (PEP-CTERM system associated)